MTTNHIAVPALVFNGVEIHDRSEMLCLTDMWKAQGSDPAQQPANWLVSAEAKNFISALNDLNPGNSGVMAKKGKNGGTYAHWQIGLAYAKYLSPEFHMWCNTVVRERMEGKPEAASLVLDAGQKAIIGGIVKTVVHGQIAEMEKAVAALPALVETVNTLMAIVQPPTPGVVIRHGKTAGAILKGAGITGCPTRLALWFGNRLEAAGCRVEGRLDTGTGHARLFDPDRAEAWLKNGGKAAVERKIAERNGQGALSLSGRGHRAASLPAIPPDMDNDGIGAIIVEGAPVYFDIRVKKLEPGARYVVINVKGDVLVDIPECSMAGRGGTMGPRGVLTSPRLEAVPGMRDPIPTQWEGVILGKVIERQNVVRIPVSTH